ncbi:hypothetical protein D3C71_1833480 [compost metagenome]
MEADISANPGFSAASLWKVAPIAVGAIALVRMLKRPHSEAALRVSPTMADFAVL